MQIIKEPLRQYLPYETYEVAEWVWPGASIPYLIDASFTENMKNFLKSAIQEFEKKTPLRFILISDTSKYDQYIKYYKNPEKVSYVKWIGRSKSHKEHPVYINEEFPYGTYLHETMHILGFEHEQCREDRDNYVCIKFSVQDSPGLQYQYEKKGYLIGDYDPDSVMHYALNENMTSKDKNNDNRYGQRNCLSLGDIKGIKCVYEKSKCTYEFYQENYVEQDYYECTTCWGPDSDYGACIYCGITCHQGHKLELKKSQSFVCDCGRYKHKNQLCTRQSTNKKPVKQSMYLCHDCFDVAKYQKENKGSTPGVCYSCAQKCHKSHKLEYYRISNEFFCDCGLEYCKTKQCQAI